MAMRPNLGFRATFVCALGTVTAALFLSGCSSPASSTPNHSVSPPTPISSVLEQHQPQSAASWWASHPDEEPTFFSTASLVVEYRGTGTQTVKVPTDPHFKSLGLVLSCGTPDPYQLTVRESDGTQLSWTGGNACSRHSDETFETPPLKDPGSAGLQIEVSVPPSTDYYLDVFAGPSN